MVSAYKSFDDSESLAHYCPSVNSFCYWLPELQLFAVSTWGLGIYNVKKSSGLRSLWACCLSVLFWFKIVRFLIRLKSLLSLPLCIYYSLYSKRQSMSFFSGEERHCIPYATVIKPLLVVRQEWFRILIVNLKSKEKRRIVLKWVLKKIHEHWINIIDSTSNASNTWVYLPFNLTTLCTSSLGVYSKYATSTSFSLKTSQTYWNF